MSKDLKFEQGDLVLCEHWGESYRAHIEKCPRPDRGHRAYQIRISGGRGLTHALEKNLTMIKPKRDIKNSVNYKSKK